MNTKQTLLKQVTIQQLEDYLVGKGWSEEPFGRDEVRKFKSPRDGWHILIPSRRELIDYDRVTFLAIHVVAGIEDREFDDVLSDVLPCSLVELIELRALIADCEQLILKHGGDFALSQSLTSLKARETSLDSECAMLGIVRVHGIGDANV